MQLFTNIQYLAAKQQNCVASIGNYDGMHRGHQAVLARVKEQADIMRVPSLVIMFEPQTMEYFLKERRAVRLMTLREKLSILQQHGIDLVLCLRFNAELARLPADKFIQNILLDTLKVQYIIVGDDFAFGCNRAGGFEILQEYMPTEKIPTIQIAGTKVSSTHIRQALAIGDFRGAEALLGRPYTMSGRVAHGDASGRKLSFPTANIYVRHTVLPLRGVYAARVNGLNAKPLAAVAYVGNRPTVNGVQNVLEIHLLNFDKDIYGARIQVEFVNKIRDEIKFASLDLMQQQIKRDIKKVQQYDRI